MRRFKMFKTILRLSLFLIVVSVFGCDQMTTEGKHASRVPPTPSIRIPQPTFRPTHQPQDGSLVAIYDVSDLLINIPNHDLPENMFTWTRVTPHVALPCGDSRVVLASDKLPPVSDSDQMKEQLQNRIRELIQATVAHGSWKSPMLLQYNDDAMIVRQTEENHKQIERLLEQMRDTRRDSVKTDARVFVVSAAEAEKMQSWIDKHSFRFEIPPTYTTFKNKKEGENHIYKQCLSPEKFQKMGDYLATQKITSFASPRLTTYNGQKAYVSVANRMIVDVSRAKESESISLTTQSGYGLSTDVTIAHGYKYVMCSLNFQMRILAPDVPQKKTTASPYGITRSAANEKTTVLIPNKNVCVLRFPVNQMAVTKIKDVRGPKAEESVDVEESLIPSTPETQRYVYLFLKPKIVRTR
jgi:hypothetical protein